MARYTEASCRQCRREGMKLYLKGERCYSTNKCAFERRPTPPGQHGKRRTKLSEYGLQLREKQKVKRIYGVLEKQFAHYFDLAEKQKGITGSNLLEILETRLDNVVYRLGLATTRRQARQLVNHGHITVDGKRVDIPSYEVKPGQVISLRERSKNLQVVKDALEAVVGRAPFVSFDENKMEGSLVRLPEREELDANIDEALVVEYYNKL